MNTLVVGVLLAIIYAFADRFSGGGWPWSKLSRDHGGPLPGRPVAYAVMISGALVWMLCGVKAAVFASLVFAIWRWPAWRVMGRGGLTPTTGLDTAALALRHALAAVSIPLAMLVGLDPLDGLTGLLFFVWIATVIGTLYGDAVKIGRDIGPQTELVRGLAFGMMIWWFIG